MLQLRLGRYTAMGQESCCGYPALGCHSVHQEDGCAQARRDAETFVSWGVDYIKVDTVRACAYSIVDRFCFLGACAADTCLVLRAVQGGQR